MLAFATDRQREILQAVIDTGSGRAAALHLKVDPAYPPAVLKAVKQKAARQGYSPEHDMTRTVPDGFNVRGVSTYYDSEGRARGQWVKSSADEEMREEARQEAFRALGAELPRLAPVEPPAASLDALCNLYVITDAHVGMLAWHREGGEDWDLDIAERQLVGCFERMISSSPPAKQAVVCQLGDFLHFDSIKPVTPAHQHLLDADSRWRKLIPVAVRILRRIIDCALLRHDQVHVVMAEGNHDESSSAFLQHMFALLYENEPRVTVDDSALPYYVHEFGNVMLAFHHGHKKQKDALPLLFAAQYPEVWGRTKKRYGHSGHEHHEDVKEHSGMNWTQHPTLAARDAHAARGGWISERAATGTTYHAQYGRVGTVTVTPEMLAA